MDAIKEDVIKMWNWAEREFDPEEVHRLRTEVQFAIHNLNQYINNEFKRKAMGKASGMR